MALFSPSTQLVIYLFGLLLVLGATETWDAYRAKMAKKHPNAKDTTIKAWWDSKDAGPSDSLGRTLGLPPAPEDGEGPSTLQMNISGMIEQEMLEAFHAKDDEAYMTLEERRIRLQKASQRGDQPHRAQTWNRDEYDHLNRPVGRTRISCGHGQSHHRNNPDKTPMLVSSKGIDDQGNSHRHWGRDKQGRRRAIDAGAGKSWCGDCEGNGGLKVNRNIGDRERFI